MRRCCFESETPRFSWAEDQLELVRTKNVIELSVLHRGTGALGAQEYELTSNVSTRLEKARPHVRDLAPV
jgi:hypothetical protein